MHAEQREVEESLGHEVAVGTRRRGCCRSGRRSRARRRRRRGRAAGTSRRGRRRRAATRRARRRASTRRSTSRASAQPWASRWCAEQHRLGALQVRVAGQVAAPASSARASEHALQLERRPADVGGRPLAPQPHRGRDLIVAAAAGVELGAGSAGQLGDARSMAVWMSSSAGEARTCRRPAPRRRGRARRRARRLSSRSRMPAAEQACTCAAPPSRSSAASRRSTAG